ncbi:glycosyltransferase family 4 protein [Roseomonas sp. AR75]|uniref:glycosyltransferase family 4 protein n=1 Tax=Roseomonas sp. AR75 TaxID=2562311 RepID=UPI0010C074B2|nr:glycosyltransferase family 4 protein [Roseomonas sp. AR75]
MESSPDNRRIRLAIILAAEWRGGMLRNALLLARLYASRAWEGIGTVEVVVALPRSGPYDWQALRRWCREVGGISIRPFAWRPMAADAARVILPEALVPPGAAPVLLPDDGGRELRDADAWLFFASHGHARIPWLRPTAVFCADLLPRRVAAAHGGPHGFGDRSTLAEAMIGWRRARCAFATTPTTHSDLVSYAGVHPDRAVLAPLQTEAAMPETEIVLPPAGSEPGILWVTNRQAHKNHLAAVAALRGYVSRGGGLDITVCGVSSRALDPATGSDHPGARALADAPEVLARMHFVGEPPDPTYRRLVASKGVLWHNVLADNGTFAAFDAAMAGAHLVSSDYPPMRHICDRHGVAALFHPARDPDAAATALLEAERRLRAGIAPGHDLRPTSEADLVAAYGDILGRLMAHG